MKVHKKLLVMALFLSAQLAVPAHADDEADTDELDVTLTVVEADEDVEDAVSTIELPEEASAVAKENAAFGLATANAARQRGEDESEEVEGTAAAAAEQAKEAAKNARETARESAKNANEAAEEAVKNALSGGGTENIPEDVLDNIPGDVKDRLPIDPGSVIDNIGNPGEENRPGS